MKPGVAWYWQVGATYMIKVQELTTLDQYSCLMVQTSYSKESKTAFKMLQNISFIVCIKNATKCVDLSSTKWPEWGSQWVYVKYVLLNCSWKP